MAGGRKTTKGGKSARSAQAALVAGKGKPWGTIIAVVVLVVLAAGVFGYTYVQLNAKHEQEAALAQWTPSDTNKDPSDKITGVVKKDYPSGLHVQPTQRVAYDQAPPFGGPHDGFWADCMGIVYPKAVRSENMVHALEHGSVWIAYNPDEVSGSQLDVLKQKVNGKQFLMLSPYPGLDHPVSVQSWGHQLKVDDVNDPRIDEFVKSLLRNQYTYPEVGASCDALGPGQFDPANPPAFDPSKPGPDAVPMSGQGATNNGDQRQPSGAMTTPPVVTSTTKPNG
ncbi:DUF3105 domain-containing protein [Kutzneria albida]|uniref:DUF3105 domain-containing protein n=1 Tax=Kutzneria albida DSM 43870 TaxID=1449976 RepID=W5WS43_9PSEU|nr:DUF3105 domain-containing protein [Kutzneria albida]AHI00990.1 hypothetical protein KALB_7632 [Kutzneria albida DSM 43870]